MLSDEALATMLKETRESLYRTKDVLAKARQELGKAEGDRYIAEVTGNVGNLRRVADRVSGAQAVVSLHEGEERSLLLERSAIEAERKRRMQMAEGAKIAERDRQRAANRRAAILAAGSPAQRKSRLDRARELVGNTPPVGSPLSR